MTTRAEPLADILTTEQLAASAQVPGCALTIVQQVQEAIFTDDTDDSERIIQAYEEATAEQRAVVDDIFISLCGYRLATFIERWRSNG